MPKQPHTDLARLQLADFRLGTQPYTAHTTASDALRAGCPVLTRPGDTLASRVAASLLLTLDLDDLVVTDDAAFVRKATSLARDPDARVQLRRRLLAARAASPLFDMTRFAAAFAGTSRAMALRWRDGLAAARPTL